MLLITVKKHDLISGFISFIKDLVIPEIKANKIVFIAITLFLTGFFLIVILSEHTIIEKLTISKFVAFFSVIGLLFSKKVVFPKYKIGTTEYFLLNFFGFGPFVTSLLLLINFSFTNETTISTHNIVHYELKETFSLNSPQFLIDLDDQFLENYEVFRMIQIGDMPQRPQQVTYSISTGILGVKILNWQKLE